MDNSLVPMVLAAVNASKTVLILVVMDNSLVLLVQSMLMLMVSTS